MKQKEVPTIQVVVRSLTNWLGPALVGELCGLNGPAPLKRWQVQPPSVDEEAKLRTGHEVFTILRRAECADTARAWMIGMNPLLEDKNPIDEIGHGNGRNVLAAARTYLQDPMIT